MLPIIIAVLGLMFFLVYTAFELQIMESKHEVFAIFLIAFAFLCSQFIPKILLDYNMLPDNHTTTLIFVFVTWIIRIFIAYLVLYFLSEIGLKKALLKFGQNMRIIKKYE